MSLAGGGCKVPYFLLLTIDGEDSTVRTKLQSPNGMAHAVIKGGGNECHFGSECHVETFSRMFSYNTGR